MATKSTINNTDSLRSLLINKEAEKYYIADLHTNIALQFKFGPKCLTKQKYYHLSSGFIRSECNGNIKNDKKSIQWI